jgi:hypothetical protein
MALSNASRCFSEVLKWKSQYVQAFRQKGMWR